MIENVREHETRKEPRCVVCGRRTDRIGNVGSSLNPRQGPLCARDAGSAGSRAEDFHLWHVVGS